MSIAPLAPGRRVGILALYLKNGTTRPLTLSGIEFQGTGVGAVVKVAGVQASPELGGIHSLPSGAYAMAPPVATVDGECHAGVLQAFEGTSIQPGAEWRAWVVLEGVAVGAYDIPVQVVTYTQGASTFEQRMALGYRGNVQPSSRFPVVTKDQEPCVKPGTLLNP